MSVISQSPPARTLRRLVSFPAPPVPGSDAGGHAPDLMTMERGAWTLVWLGVLTGGVSLWGFWWSSATTVVMAAVLVLAGIAGTVASWVARSPRARWFQCSALAGVLAVNALPQAIVIHTRAFYSTDAAAFDDVSAHALLHGLDPYTASMTPAAALLKFPPHYWTYTINGGHVSHASYPAGSFLVDMPALALGIQHHVVDWTDLAAWLVTAALLFLLLPVWIRWLGALVALTPIFVGMFSNSGTDAAFLPFMVLAVWRWDRFAAGTAAGPSRWIGPVALGLACAIKQLPWFCVPVLALGTALEARRAGQRPVRTACSYLAVVVLAFALVNAPFVAWQPGAWLRGTLTPLIDPLVADGQGLVALATHGVTGGVDLGFVMVAGALAYVAVLGAFAVWYRALKRVWPLMLPAVFFFATRSLSSYFVDLFPVAVVALFTVAPAPAASPALDETPPAPRLRRAVGGGVAPWRTRVWAWAGARPWLAVAAPGAGVVLAAALAFTGAPLSLSVRSVVTSHHGRVVNAVTVRVDNRTGQRVTPHFMVNTGDNPDGFWKRADGKSITLAPRASVTVTLVPPAPDTAPQPGAQWLVEAYTTAPRALSTSPLVLWRGRG